MESSSAFPPARDPATPAPPVAQLHGLAVATGLLVTAACVLAGPHAALALAAIGAVTALAFAVRPLHLLLVAILVCPLWIPVELSGRSAPLPPTDFLVAALAGVLLLKLVVSPVPVAWLWTDVFFGGYMLCAILSLPYAQSLSSVAFSFKAELVAYAVFRMTASLTEGSRDTRAALIAVVVALTGVVAGFFYLFVSAYATGGELAVFQRRAEFVSLPWARSNTLAAYLALNVPLSAALVLWRGPRLVRIAATAVFAASVASVLLAMSRGAVLGLAAGTLVFLWVNRRRPAVIGLTAGAVLAVALAASSTTVLQSLAARFSTSGDDLSSQARLAMWDSYFDSILAHPLFGAGLENTHIPYAAAQIKGEGDAHNAYIKTAAQVGLVGLAFRMAMFGSFAAIFWRRRRDLLRVPAFYAGTAALFVGSMVNALVESVFSGDRYLIFFMVMMGLLVAWDRRTRPGVPEPGMG